MFEFIKRKAAVFSHWYSLVPDLHTSSDEFYSSVEDDLKALRVPGLTMSRVDFAEGGILSDKRTYLRIVRERLVFDVCAAPFGTAYFFSLRAAEIPCEVKLWELLAFAVGILVALIVSFTTFTKVVGAYAILLYPVACLITAVFLIYILRNAIALGLQDLDTSLIKMPVVGPVYERFLRKETYYRHDTRIMYHTTVNQVVIRKVEHLTAANGINLIREYIHDPFLRDLYERRLVHNDQKNTLGEAARQSES